MAKLRDLTKSVHEVRFSQIEDTSTARKERLGREDLQIVDVDCIPSGILRVLFPNDIKGLYLVSERLSIPLADDVKHGGNIHHKRDLVVGMCQKSNGGHLCLKRLPRGLGPDHDVIVLVAIGQEFVQVRTHDVPQRVVERFTID